jgi:hypothetical protein
VSVAYEPFVLPLGPVETRIERVPSDRRVSAWLDEWKALQRRGWDCTVLLAPDAKTLVGLGCRYG